MKLWQHQKKIVEENKPFRGHFIYTGGGKTTILLELIKKNALSVLCLAPKSLETKWEKELKYVDFIPYKVMTPYYLKRDWDKIPYYDAIVIDEADSPYGGQNKTHKALLKYLKKNKPRFLWLATATPYRSTPINVYNLGILCKYQPMSYIEFRSRIFYQEYFGAQAVWTPKLKHPNPKVKAETQKELNAYMANYADIVNMEDVVDVPEIIYDVEPIALNSKQQTAIKKLDKFTTNRSVLFRYVNEVENGYLDEKGLGKEETYLSLKLDRILDLVNRHNIVVVFSEYKHQQQAIYNHLKKNYKGWLALVNGDNSKDAPELSEHLEKLANEGKEGVLIASPRISAGWEVKSCRLAVFASLPWSYQAWVQAQGRILRSNNLQKTTYKILVADHKKSVDRRVYESLKSSTTFDPTKFEY